MKKLVISIAMGLSLASALYAACLPNGALCWDESGNVTINGLLITGNGMSMPSLTVAQMNTTAPNNKGQVIFVSNGNQAGLCISTGTSAGAYVVVAASSNVVGGGLLSHCN